jgi:hypothetical protein
MEALRDLMIALVDALIPRRYEGAFLVGILFVVGMACLAVGGWFLYRSVGEDGEALWVPTALFGAMALVSVVVAVRALRRRH